MLNVASNELLTRVGAGTPCGELMRRYWHPIAASAQLDENPVRQVTLLGEDLVLFRDRGGRLGLIDNRCPHRGVKLEYGIPDERGLRCAYHGWLFDAQGQCLDQPAEPEGSRFKEKVRAKAYPVQELAGMIFAYLGPAPAPLLPRWDRLVWAPRVRTIGICKVPCNWLQVMENFPDFAHAEHLHGRYFRYMLERNAIPKDDPLWTYAANRVEKRIRKLGWDLFEHGINNRVLVEGQTEENDMWRIGSPLIFPNIASPASSGVSTLFTYVVPLDDTHTLRIYQWIYDFSAKLETPPQPVIPYVEYPWDVKTEKGPMMIQDPQDNTMFVTQGEIADRTTEMLGESDRGIILYRRLLREQIERVQQGKEPMNVFREPAGNQCIELPLLSRYYGVVGAPGRDYARGYATTGLASNISPIRDLIEDLYVKYAKASRDSAA